MFRLLRTPVVTAAAAALPISKQSRHMSNQTKSDSSATAPNDEGRLEDAKKDKEDNYLNGDYESIKAASEDSKKLEQEDRLKLERKLKLRNASSSDGGFKDTVQGRNGK